MSQTMEQIDTNSLRESEDADKKQKSRRPPSMSPQQEMESSEEHGENDILTMIA